MMVDMRLIMMMIIKHDDEHGDEQMKNMLMDKMMKHDDEQ